jgi:hypothetical protein
VVPRSRGGTRTLHLCEKCHSLVHDSDLKLTQLVREGMARAKASGKKIGRPRQVSAEEIKRLFKQGIPAMEIASRLGVPYQTVYRWLKN